jgi:hypothetical protein
LKLLWHLGVIERRHEVFKSGHLIDEWITKYPSIFDSDDIRLARSQGVLGYKFYEWLSAVTIFNTTGYLSLIEKYDMPSHFRKYNKFKEIIDGVVFDYIVSKKEKGTQPPDLFCFDEISKDWFFVEVKGKNDRLSQEQTSYFANIEKLSKREIRVMTIEKKNQIGKLSGINIG